MVDSWHTTLMIRIILYIRSWDVLESISCILRTWLSSRCACCSLWAHGQACESCYLEPKVIYSLSQQISWAVGKAEPASKDSCAFNSESLAKCNSRFLLKRRLKLTAALRLQMGMSPQSNLLHCQQTLTSRLTLLSWACWRLSLGCKKHLGSSIPKALRPPLSLCEQESGEHEPAHTQNIQGRSLCVSMLEGMLSLLERKCWTNGDLFQSCHHSLSLPVGQQAKDMPKGLGGHLMPLSLSSLFLQNILFPNRDYGPLFHRRIRVNQNKRGSEILWAFPQALKCIIQPCSTLWSNCGRKLFYEGDYDKEVPTFSEKLLRLGFFL